MLPIPRPTGDNAQAADEISDSRQYLEVLVFPISELGKLEPSESILRIDLQDLRPKFAKFRQGYGSDIHRGTLACKPRPSLVQMNGPDNDENYSPIRLA